MLKNLLNYLKFSGVWIGFVVNPYHWEFKAEYSSPTDLDPAQHKAALHIGPFWIRGVIDDGTY